MAGTDLRRSALFLMVIAIATLAVSLVAGDRSAGSDPDVVRPTASTTPAATESDEPTGSGPTPVASSVPATLTISRLWSPGPNLARAEGTASANRLVVSLTVDGEPQPDATIAGTGGDYILDIEDLEPGPQEICLADVCQRVLVSAPAG